MTAQSQGQLRTRDKVQRRQAPPSVQHAELRAAPVAGRLDMLRAALDPGSARPQCILALQRAAGNRAVSRLIQTKLTVGGANDRYEQEADRVAESVVTMPSPRSRRVGAPGVQRQAEANEIQTAPLAASISRLVQRQASGEEEEVQTKSLLQRAPEEEEVQTKSEGIDGSFAASRGMEHRLSALRAGGSPLPGSVRGYMEPRFGADFGGVRLHADSEAGQLNQQLQARAFTHGQDIYLGAGAPAPGTTPGNQLLAHELAHTIQQGAAHRIQGWWPKGHLLVTDLAAKEGSFHRWYSDSALKYLKGRSPDIDFLQDQFETMGAGQKQSQARLDIYEQLIASGEVDRAKKMYENNDLHLRRPEYMLSHGEGGRYKVPDGSGINEAMTSRMVDKAVSLWYWGDTATYGPSLSVLSDALHQAEDRGSHSEGNQFSGHDVRVRLGKRQWERKHYLGPEWDPDNAEVNQKGALMGVGFAQGVLTKFATGVGAGTDIDRELIDIPKGVQVPGKRKLKAKSWLPSTGSGTALAAIAAEFGHAHTGGGAKHLKKVFGEGRKSSEIEYEDATKAPGEEHASQGERAPGGALDKGMSFYEHGRAGLGKAQPGQEQDALTRASSAFLAAMDKFQALKKPGTKKATRIQLAKQYLDSETKGVPEGELDLFTAAIEAAYLKVFKEPLFG